MGCGDFLRFGFWGVLLCALDCGLGIRRKDATGFFCAEGLIAEARGMGGEEFLFWIGFDGLDGFFGWDGGREGGEAS